MDFMRTPAHILRASNFLAGRNPKRRLALVMIVNSLRLARTDLFCRCEFILALDLRLVLSRVKQRNKNQQKSAGVQARRYHFVRSHPTGDSRFKMLGSAPRQRASGLPRTTPRSPFLEPEAPGVFGHAGVFATNRPVDRILNNQGRGGCLGSVLWPVFYFL
jgi:hypothetical protein